jgi:hypothetical protein
MYAKSNLPSGIRWMTSSVRPRSTTRLPAHGLVFSIASSKILLNSRPLQFVGLFQSGSGRHGSIM